MASTPKMEGGESMAPESQQSQLRKDAVKEAQSEVRRAETLHEKFLAREKKALAQYKTAKSRAKGNNLKRFSNAVISARQRKKEATELRVEASTRLREAKKLLREQKQLVKEAEQKERAKERAVAVFLKKWEREYDLEMRRKKQNIKLRKEQLRE